MKNWGFVFYLFITSIVLLEIILSVWNPFPSRLRGNKIELKANYQTVFHNNSFPSLEEQIIVTRNSIGLRGEEPPNDLSQALKIITVGGSTTECVYISDEKTWPYLLGLKLKEKVPNLWLNNAGLDGHSTFGHAILLEDYIFKLKPDYIIFLVGCNDVAREDLSSYDKKQFSKNFEEKNWKEHLMDHSNIINTFFNLKRAYYAKNKLFLGHGYTSDDGKEFSTHEKDSIRSMHEPYLSSYEKRLINLIKLTINNGVKPILINQPTLNRKTYRYVLNLYNQKTRIVAESLKVPFIDLEGYLPKSKKIFYDDIHFTPDGCQIIADYLDQKVFDIIKIDSAF